MASLLCGIWPFLAGALIAWLLAGWLPRQLRFVESAGEQSVEVEKVIDNPEHLDLIKRLQSENTSIPGLRARIAELENAAPKVVERLVEKPVDNPEHLSLIASLQEENASIDALKARIAELENAAPKTVERVVEKIVDRPVEKIVEKPVDNPALQARVAELEAENAAIPELEARIAELERSRAHSGDTTAVSETAARRATGRPDFQESAARGDPATKADMDRAAAKAAGFKIKAREGRDDFTVIEGIGPKINGVLLDAGLRRYHELATMTAEKIQEILDAAGARYSLARPTTWPDQAKLAAANDWQALRDWQDELKGGRESS